jgi:hypothetical protein
MATIKKAQTGGTYYASSKGRVGRLSGSKIGDNISAVQNESIDTTGYSKGKKNFTKTVNRTFEKPSSKIVKREDVTKTISDLKKGATQKMDLRTPNQKKKSKMKNGGSLSGLTASNKRVGPVDPKGAFTKVQKKTLAGAKGKASLTKDKQLGATKMAKRGMSIKKK